MFSRSNLSIDKMATNLRADDRLDGEENSRSLKHRILLILEDNDILNYIKEFILEPKEEGAKKKYKNNVTNAKLILFDAIKGRLIPHMLELNTHNEMFESSTRVCEIKTIIRNLLLRYQLRNVTMDKLESLSTYFTRVS